MPVWESNRGAVVDDVRLRRLYSWPSGCFLDVRHVGMRYTVRSRVMLRQQEQLLLAPDGSGSHTHALRRRLAGLGRMGVGVCCIQAEYHALPGALLSTIQGYSALTCPAGLHLKTTKTGELSTEACSR